MAEIFPRAPLIETVFEIRFPACLKIAENKSEFHEKVKKDFPEIFFPNYLVAPEPFVGTLLFRFDSTDKSKSLQFSVSRFSYHDRKYRGYEGFAKEALKYVDLFCSTYKIAELQRTGLRYVNHIPFLMEQNSIPLHRFLNVKYIYPESVGSKFSVVQNVIVTHLGSGKLKIVIQNQTRPDGKPILLLDFDFSHEGELKSNELKKYIADSHTHTKKVFLELITEDYKKVIRGNS